MISMFNIAAFVFTMTSIFVNGESVTSSNPTNAEALLRHMQQRSNAVRSKYMMELYRAKNTGMPTNNALKRSDIVRSFRSIESYKVGSRLVVVFDLSSVPRERIRGSELQVDRSLSDVTMIELWEGVNAESRRKIGTMRYIRTNKSFDTTSQIRRWHRGDSPVTPFHASGAILPLTPLLVVYSNNHHYDLIEASESRMNRQRRSSRGRHSNRYRKRRYRVNKNKTRKSTLRHNDVEITSHAQQKSQRISNDFELSTSSADDVTIQSGNEYDVTDEWRKQQSDDVKVVKAKHPVSPQRKHPFIISTPAPRVGATHCRKVSFEIDFEKIGWGSWIVYPKKYNAYRCEGQCRTPMRSDSKPTNHAYMQSIIATKRPDLHIPQPCCVPTKLKPLSILYYEDGEVKQRDHEDMVVDECGCR
uniref:Transforming growth factor beta superfamily signaling ligand n=1 Tax=Ciona intestinalis TaxID=7719 RepID=Q4H337_CIOIN|nr:transforming growth factor beta superfamily signaling ligand precursor [Ciona intestinalis]BAE06590.1 transforming growth factor beta superfamily signaling ligand [Ciona intestinalis]|eukprot:NP_001072000.1 transforming growth factor beta superfamily signaling ligand precursor [Ciona intestinalis]